MAPVKESWLRRGLVVLTVAVAVLCSCCDAARPGGQVGVTLTPSHSVVIEDGSTVEEYELRQSNPMLAHFVSLGLASHKMLQASGYAFGTLVRISHSDRDKEYGEGPDRKDWFPMVLLLDVTEEGPDDGQEDVTAQYEIVLDYNPQTFTSPGLVILEARKLDADGGAAVSLEVLPPEPMGFLERNRKGITMMFGVIIASSVVKFMRKNIERLARKAKQDEEGRELEKEEGASAPGRGGGSSIASAAAPSTEKKLSPQAALGKKGDKPKKKKAGNTKQD